MTNVRPSQIHNNISNFQPKVPKTNSKIIGEEYQFEEETKLIVPSSSKLKELFRIVMGQNSILPGYKFECENSLEKPVIVEDVYFDTEDQALLKSGNSYRFRTTYTPHGRVYTSLQFKKFKGIKGAKFEREEFKSYFNLDNNKDLLTQAQDWISGEIPNKAYQGLKDCLGKPLNLKPSLKIHSKRSEILLTSRTGKFKSHYLLDIFLDEITVAKNGKTSTFHMVEAEIPDIRNKSRIANEDYKEFIKEANIAMGKFTELLEKDKKFIFKKTNLNKYQMSSELMKDLFVTLNGEHTAIIATIGPSSERKDVLVEMAKNGMDVARINFSRRNDKEIGKMFDNIKAAEKESGKRILVLADLSGRKLRTGQILNHFTKLEKGSYVVLTKDKIIGDSKRIQIVDEELYNAPIGTSILMKDAKVEIKVTGLSKEGLQCEVVRPGIIGDNTGVHYEGLTYSNTALTDKDKKDMLFAAKNGADAIALSFINNKKDIEEARSFLKSHGINIPLVAKIETRDAIKNLDEIIKTSDAVIVARGDMGVTCSLGEVPIFQKVILSRCKTLGKPAIVATEMMLSMQDGSRSLPTRAESIDVEYAVFDGAKGAMLCGETNSGTQPVEVIKWTNSLLRTAEAAMKYGELFLKPELFGAKLIEEWHKNRQS